MQVYNSVLMSKHLFSLMGLKFAKMTSVSKQPQKKYFIFPIFEEFREGSLVHSFNHFEKPLKRVADFRIS